MTRKQQPMLMWSSLTDSCYVVLRYKDLGGNNFEALEKYDVTQDFLRLVETFNREYNVRSNDYHTRPTLTGTYSDQVNDAR